MFWHLSGSPSMNIFDDYIHIIIVRYDQSKKTNRRNSIQNNIQIKLKIDLFADVISAISHLMIYGKENWV